MDIIGATLAATLRQQRADRAANPGDTDILAIFGPTAVGKSAVAVEVALGLDGEIVSADSMQVYRGLALLTDQPSPEMLAAVPHHLIGMVPLQEEYSAARFSHDARDVIGGINDRGRLPLLVGGTGLYVRSLLGGFSFAGRGGEESRSRWNDFIRDEGLEAAFQELERIDPLSAASIDPGIRAAWSAPWRQPRPRPPARARPLTAERHLLWSAASPYRVLSFGLVAPREDIYRQIDERVDRMLASGAIDEVREARSHGRLRHRRPGNRFPGDQRLSGRQDNSGGGRRRHQAEEPPLRQAAADLDAKDA